MQIWYSMFASFFSIFVLLHPSPQILNSITISFKSVEEIGVLKIIKFHLSFIKTSNPTLPKHWVSQLEENSSMSSYCWTPHIYYQDNLYKRLNHAKKSLKPISWRHKSTGNLTSVSSAVELLLHLCISPYFVVSSLTAYLQFCCCPVFSGCRYQKKAIMKLMASQAVSFWCTWPRFFFPCLTAKPITSIVWQRLRILVLLQCFSLQNNAFIPTPSVLEF